MTLHSFRDKPTREVCLMCLCLLFLFTVLLHNALPFVGFGFLDNCIMIVAVSLSASCTVVLSAPAAQRFIVCSGFDFHRGIPVNKGYVVLQEASGGSVAGQ